MDTITKTLLIAMLTLFGLSNIANAQIVNIPDANFKALLVNNPAINTNADTEIQVSEANAFTGTISLSSGSITNLTGLSAFTALTIFDCAYTQETSLDVSANTALTKLYVYYNTSLTSLNLSANTALTLLSVNGTPITSLDLSANTALTSVNASFNDQLTSLNLKNGNNTNLTNFTSSNSSLTCIQVDNATAAHPGWSVGAGVNFSTNCALPAPCAVNIPDVNFKIVLLNQAVNSNGDGEIQCSEASAFTGQLLVNGGVSDFTGLSAFTALTDFSCQSASATSLNLSANTALTTLLLSSTQITSLDLSANTALINLFVASNNQLTSLNLSANTALTNLNVLSNPQLTSLNLKNGNNTNLTSLNASDNPALTCIQVDDVSAANANSNWQKDTTANYSTNCNPITAPPTATDQTFVSGATVANLVATGTAIQWYEVATGGLVLPSSTPLVTGMYYCSQTVNSIESERTAINVTQVTLIPDTHFEQALINLGYDDIIDGSVITSHISSLTTLDVTSKNISDLTGIQDFISLQVLYCYSNQLTALDVSKNTSLTQLNCSNNQLTALDVTKNTALSYLYCYSNPLTALDVSKNTSLTQLGCGNNQLPALDVTKNTTLNLLSCDNNQLTALDVTKNTALTRLYCSNNQLTALDVTKNTALNYLSCNSNSLTALDVSKNTSLTQLICNNNQLTALDVSKNTSLTQFTCDDNQLTALDVTKNTALTQLYCYSNPLTALDVSKNTSLTQLGCYNNQLTTLDVTKNTALNYLYCSNNQLATLDVTKNTTLNLLSCDNNQLIALDVTKNTALNYLYCNNNQLTALDVTKNTTLQSLYCDNNQLTCIQVNDVAAANANPNWPKDATANYSTNCSPIIAPPTASGQTFVSGATVANLVATGTAIQWYDVATGGLVLPPNTSLVTGIYYCSQTVNGIESERTAINVTQVTLIPNANFEQALINLGYDDIIDGSVITSHISSLTSLNVNSEGILDLKGIQDFISLQTLTCYNNQLTALDVTKNTSLTQLICDTNQLTTLDVTKNTALQSLYCSNNQLNVLDITKNTSLTQLNCSNNQLTILDVTKNTALTYLGCNNNQLTVLDVTKNTVLIDLDCSNNQLTALDITKNNSLTQIYCYNNQLTALDVTKNTNLNAFFCNNNQLTCIQVNDVALANGNPNWYKDATANYSVNCSPITAPPTASDQTFVSGATVANLVATGTAIQWYDVATGGMVLPSSTPLVTGMYYCSQTVNSIESERTAINVTQVTLIPDPYFEQALINLGYDDIIDGSVITSHISSVTFLYVPERNILDLTGIQDFISLQTLYCNNNQLTALDVTKNTALTYLSCYSNHLTILDTTNNTALTQLISFNNQLTALDVTKNTTLATLSCYGNQLNALDLTKNTALTILSCSNNQLTALDVTKNTALQTLYCDNNQLTTLDVTKNITLINLSCGNDQLTALDLTNNTALTQVQCYSNHLTALDVTKNTTLIYLYCYNNQLTALDVTKNTALNYLGCYSNQLNVLDVTKNTALSYLGCYSNQLTALDVTKNTTLATLTCNGNLLTCIQVDDVAAANANSNWFKDATANYSVNCGVVLPPIVNIPDPIFKALLVNNPSINTNDDTEIQVSEATAFTGVINANNLSITDFTGIEAFTALTVFSCSNAQATSLNLSTNMELTSLTVNNTPLTGLDLSANTALKVLTLENTPIISLNLSTNTVLVNLSLQNTPITSLNLSVNSALKALTVDSILITSLDISANTALTFLGVYSTPITSLNLSTNTALNYLTVYNTPITSLNLIANTALTYLAVSNDTLIASLNLYTNTALTTLAVGYNQMMTSLNIKNGNNTNLTFFNATNNPLLTCIQVDDAAYMNTNWSSSKDATANYSTNCGVFLPPTAEAQSFCAGAILSNLTAIGSNLQWYSTATGGPALASSTVLATDTYYVSQTVDEVESDRTGVTVTVYTTAAPIATAQTFSTGATVANLVATGTAIQWYDALIDGTALAPTAALLTGNYYASQTVNGCESARTEVGVIVVISQIINQPINTILCSAIGSTASVFVTSNLITPNYQWQYRKVTTAIPNPAWVTITSANAGAVYSGYNTATLGITKATAALPAVGTQYQVIVGDGGSESITSDTANLTILSTAKAGTITASPTVPTVCTGGNIILTLNGYTGTSIQWQTASVLGTTPDWSDIVGETTNTYTTDMLTTTSNRYYRAIVTNSCNSTTATTATKTITVSPTAVAGTITGGAAVCDSGTGTTKYIMKVTGYVGKIQWQYSNAATDWINVDNGTATTPFTTDTYTSASSATGTSYVISNIAGDTSFRAVITSGVCTQTATTDEVSYTLIPAEGGTLVSNAEDTLCIGTGTSLTLSGYTGVIKWMKSTNYGTLGASATWSSKSGNLETLSTGNLTVTTWYKAIVSLGTMCSAESNVVMVPVYIKGVAKSITGNTTNPKGTTATTALCITDSSKILSVSLGYSGDIQWETYLTDAVSPIAPTSTTVWTLIEGANGFSYTVTGISAGKNYFRAKFTNGGCASTAVYSSPISVYYKDCVSKPTAKTVVVETNTSFDVVAYPNPYTETFHLKLSTSSKERVGISVYDMIGKLLEQRELSTSEVSELQIGSNYPSGIYNIIVNMGAEVKTLRIIKR